MKKKTRVLIVDDHRQVADAVRRSIRRTDPVEIIGACGDAATGEAMALELLPDVVLMDAMMPGADPFLATERILDKVGDRVRVLVWTGYNRDELLHRSLAHGAAGIADKGENDVDALIAIVRRVAAGEQYFSPWWEGRRLALEAGGSLSPIERLEHRERSVIRRLAAGDSVAEAAETTGITLDMAYRAIRSAREKLGCETNEQLLWMSAIECVALPENLGETLGA